MIKSTNGYNIHPLLQKVRCNQLLDYRLRQRICEHTTSVPQVFVDRIVFQSFGSFQQNNSRISNKIRKNVLYYITTDSINAIGGESYLYDKTKKCVFYTNSKYAYADFLFNGYNKQKVHLVNYNHVKLVLTSRCDIVINLGTLNENIMKQINNSDCNRIIMINCHHDNFWKRIKLLTNYKLIIRKRCIDTIIGYFITISVFESKHKYVSLGGNCAITYQLNKLGLRKYAYPFDWYEVGILKLVKILQNDFINFDEITIGTYSENHQSFIVSNKYGRFAHEVLNTQDISVFTESIQRRIMRFRELVNPVFVRLELKHIKNNDVYTSYWNSIIHVLDTIIDSYHIILISNIRPKCDTDKLKWFKLSEYIKDWTYSNLNWRKILGLL